jgi:hypothetical protein
MASTEEKSTNKKAKVTAGDNLREDTPAEKEKPNSFLKSLPTNPYVFLGLAIIAILGFGFGIYAWLDNKASRELTYYVDPARAVVVQSGKSSDLAVSYKNEPVPGDITAAQIAIWNAGKLSIKSVDALKPTVIYTEDGTPILEATIRNPGRDVSQITLDTTQLRDGRLAVKWSILERNDGAIVQLIYAGDSAVGISAEGAFEGQKSLTRISERERSGRYSAIPELFFGVVAFVVLSLWRKRNEPKTNWTVRRVLGASLTISLPLAGSIVLIIMIYQAIFSPSLPFVFD